jgi:hypothetical protein
MFIRFRLAFILLFGFSSISLFGDDQFYAVTGEVDNQFGLLDAQTGAFTQIGTLTPGNLNAGLGEVNGALYTAELYDGQLLRVNVATGATSDVGSDQAPSTFEYYALGGAGTSLYAIGIKNSTTLAELYQINPTTGAQTLIGALKVGATQLDTGTANAFLALSNGASGLYLIYDDGSDSSVLYTVNTSNGALTAVGSADGAGEFTGLATDGGALFGASTSPNDVLYTVDTSTGVLTTPVTVTGYDSGEVTYGLAPDVPEPSTILLTFAGLAAAFSLLRRNR